MIGWAIILEIPTFIVYQDDQNLPYVLRSADIQKDVYMMKLPDGNLNNIVGWFKDNDFGPNTLIDTYVQHMLAFFKYSRNNQKCV